eukprot:TRINITY_DN54429_c0_g1_i1.p1 TRINITY_DN54429_c0_g1~~TRINITY_DN54429_c0_g1_i1.p1  ORF type:complete len:657 (+),score=115.70 TRINITY_DN54429_c0_g1_i1:149-2119(+)
MNETTYRVRPDEKSWDTRHTHSFDVDDSSDEEIPMQSDFLRPQVEDMGTDLNVLTSDLVRIVDQLKRKHESSAANFVQSMQHSIETHRGEVHDLLMRVFNMSSSGGNVSLSLGDWKGQQAPGGMVLSPRRMSSDSTTVTTATWCRPSDVPGMLQEAPALPPPTTALDIIPSSPSCVAFADTEPFISEEPRRSLQSCESRRSSAASGVSEVEASTLRGRYVLNRGFTKWEKEQRGKLMDVGGSDDDDSQTTEDKPPLVQRLLASPYFDYCAAALIVSNAAVIGLKTQYDCVNRGEPTPYYFTVLNIVFCFLFSAELVFRVIGKGLRGFFLQQGRTAIWSWFDLTVVLLQIMEITIGMLLSRLSGEAVAFVRIIPVIRVVRVIRVMRFIRQFRILVTMIFGTLKTVSWALVLLMLIMYLFGIFFAQSVANHSLMATSIDPSLDLYYGRLTSTILTLFQAIIGGIDWRDAYQPLEEIGFLYSFLFIVYIIFVQLVVMNVLTGMFLQRAMEQAQSDQEHVIHLRVQEQQQFVRRLRELFEELDTSKDGIISLAEFEDHLQDKRMQALLQTVEIDTSDAWTLFKLLDTDGGGSVDLEEFVDGVQKLRGSAKSIQMAQLMYYHRCILDALTSMAKDMQKERKRQSQRGSGELRPAARPPSRC